MPVPGGRIALVAAAAATVALAGAPSGFAGGTVASDFPAAGTLVVRTTIARAKPSREARRLLVLHQFRRDFRWQVVLALGVETGADGHPWYRVSLPMRPNNTIGWIPARSVKVRPTSHRIVVDRAKRTITVLHGSKTLLRGTVAVGASGMETPVGRYYVTARFVPDDPFLGVFALETSAYSKLSEWPGGGVVGIHGTSRPDLLGQAVSHGCIRVSNATASRLRRLAPVGTPITIVD